MNLRAILIIGLIWVVPSLCFSAEDAWLLIFQNDRYELMHASSAGVTTAAKCGNYAFYANTPGSVAVVSYDTNERVGNLIVVDKVSEKLSARWPILSFPAMQMTGASK